MPDILTHIAYADEVLAHLEDRQLREQIEKRIELFRFGAQGPDFFFYHNFFKFKKDNVNAAGNLMHEIKTGEFLKFFFDTFLMGETEHTAYYDLISYYLGFVCHYVLDKTAHPFIYCYSGYNFSKGREKGLYSAVHKRMENRIDVYVWQEKKHMKACKERVHQLINIKKGLPCYVINNLHKTITQIYNIDISAKDIETSYFHMVKGLKLLYDPLGIKKILIRALELVKGEKFDTGKPLYLFDIEESRKYLNLKKNLWMHPLNTAITYNASFIDLYDLAVKEGTDMIAEIIKQLYKKTQMDMNILGNRSYLTNFIWSSKENQVCAESEGILSHSIT